MNLRYNVTRTSHIKYTRKIVQKNFQNRKLKQRELLIPGRRFLNGISHPDQTKWTISDPTGINELRKRHRHSTQTS